MTRGNKYNVAPIERRTWQGIVFDSKGEMNRYLDLLNMEKAGLISCLQRQVVFSFFYEGQHICDYEADFVYVENGAPVVEDFKAVKTSVFMIKRKMMKAWHGIDVFITGAAAKKRIPRKNPVRRGKA
jgi:hypothetical protein